MDRPVQHKGPAARLFVGDPYTDQSIKSGNVRDQTSGAASDLFVILRRASHKQSTNSHQAHGPQSSRDIRHHKQISQSSINQQTFLMRRSVVTPGRNGRGQGYHPLDRVIQVRFQWLGGTAA
jgi:hypothetical protein